MNINVQRFIIKAKPSKTNNRYYEWQTASVCLFIAENDKTIALAKAKNEMLKNHWEIIKFEDKSTLIKERVREINDEVWKAYKQAEKEGVFIKVFPDHFGAGSKIFSKLRPPKINEEFMTMVVTDAGGNKINEDDKNKLADYLIDDWLFELKDLQQEGLEDKNRQLKLAKLFEPYSPLNNRISISPEILSDCDLLKYYDIMSSPIKSQVKKASKQIKSTRNILNNKNLKGGIIYLNTGYGSLPHEQFEWSVNRYIQKDSNQFESAICISTWSLTNGFDSMIYYSFFPEKTGNKTIEKLRFYFSKRFENVMSNLIKGKISDGQTLSEPLKPLVFSVEGLDFYWEPPVLEKTW